MEKQSLIGKKFGNLTVIKQISASSWLCRCKCGNEVTVCTSKLLSRHTRSCGCLFRKATQKAVLAQSKDTRKKRVNNMVLNPKPTTANSTSTHRGVCFNKHSGMYMAYINVKGKRLYLGNYKTEAEAVAARKEAEVMYFSSKP